MINRVKFLSVLIFATLGLSGCIVVDDEVPVYSSYPYGSYEAAVDYYHRPPRPYISHHKHATPVKPNKPHLNKPHHDKKADKPKHPVKEKVHAPKKPEHPVSKKEPIKKAEPKHPALPAKDKIHMPKAQEHFDLKKNNAKNLSHKIHSGRH